MIDFIEGDLETADLLIYGTQTHLNEENVNAQMNDFMSNLLPSSAAFFAKFLALQGQMAKNRAIQLAKGAFRKTKSLWQEDAIRELTSIGELQNAPNSMKRFLMAEPTIRALWQRQLCDGYDDIMENTRGKKDEEVQEYRQVMNGMVITEDINEDLDHTYTFYDYDEDHDITANDKLSVMEQLDIYNSWHHLKRYIALGEEDPTSETNGWLSQ